MIIHKFLKIVYIKVKLICVVLNICYLQRFDLKIKYRDSISKAP
jgi:hypothetical protein